MPQRTPKQANRLCASLFISTPSGPIPLSPKNRDLPLPQGPDGTAPRLLYGPYLRALEAFLAQDDWRPLQEAVARALGEEPPRGRPHALEIVSEKHGAFYNVARAHVTFSDRVCSFALCSAASPCQQAVLERETEVLAKLEDRLREPRGALLLPRVLSKGETTYLEENGAPRTLQCFLADWLEDFHEFHLSAPSAADPPHIVVWDARRGFFPLNERQTQALYRQAARVLTVCYDFHSGAQIYPWHHAAGDFVARCLDDTVSVRLITARDYRTLIDRDADDSDPLLSLVHFFVNLTLRMRLDRLDGTGDLAWAGPPCVEATLAGFMDGWRDQHRSDPTLPDAGAILALLNDFDEPDWLGLLEAVAPDGFVESDEAAFLAPRLEEHAHRLAEALRSCAALADPPEGIDRPGR